jgi:hypothetical protein
MGEDTPSLASTWQLITDAQAEYTLRVTRAAGWLGCEPALPGHESSQVTQHMANAIFAMLAGDWHTVEQECVRACKHWYLGAFDALAVTVKFQKLVLEYIIEVLRERWTEYLSTAEKVLRDQEAILREISLPPTDQVGDVQATKEQIEKIQALALALLNCSNALNEQITSLTLLAGPENILTLVDEARKRWGRAPHDPDE